MKEALKQAGQPWQAERQLKIATKFQQICQNARELQQKQSEIKKIQSQLSGQYSDLKGALDDISAPELFDSSVKLKESEIEEKLAYCHVTAADVAKIRQQIKELEILSQKINDEELRPDIEALQDRLANISGQCQDVIRQCQAKMAQLRDLTVFVRDELNWLKESQIAITGRILNENLEKSNKKLIKFLS